MLTDQLKRIHKVRKILILGSGAVGKTSLLKVIKENLSLSELGNSCLEYARTPFLDFDTIELSVVNNDDKKKKKWVFQVYDVAGQLDLPAHPTRDLPQIVLQGVDLVLLLFANDNMQSLLDLKEWIKVVDDYFKDKNINKTANFILVKNKSDLTGVIDPSMISFMLKNESRIKKYFEVSCMNCNGINELRNWLGYYLITGLSK